MDLSSNNFDPLNFLNVDPDSLSQQELTDLRNSLNSKLGEYILLKLSDHLTEDQLDHVINTKNGPEMIETLRSYIPGLDQKLAKEMENFKTEFDNVN